MNGIQYLKQNKFGKFAPEIFFTFNPKNICERYFCYHSLQSID